MKGFKLIFTIIILCFVINGQEKNTQFYLPIIPIIAEYEYAPQYFSQSFNHPQYSMIETIGESLEANKTPVLQVILTETDSKRRIFYTNSKDKAVYLKNEGKEVYQTNIDFKKTQEVDQQPTFSFALRDKSGQPIIWRVNYASRPSERGAGLTPFSQDAGLKLDFRDLGTTVGEGTAIQIGEKIIEAEYWKEVSSPPYFIAYRGSVTIGRHIGALLLGSERWSVLKSPNKLEKGEKWILIDNKGRQRVLEISNFYHDGNEVIVDEVNSQFAQASLIRLVILITPQGFALRAYEIKSKAEEMRIKFETPLPIHATDSADFEIEFTINQGNNKKIVSGKIIGNRQKDSYTKLKWQFYAPKWTSKKILESLIKLEPKGYSIETQEVTK